MAASDSFSLDDGMRTVSWLAVAPLRSRVSMSAIGSVIVIGGLLSSPAGLRHARHLAGVHHLAEADPAQVELAVDGPRPPTPLAAGVGPHLELGLALLLLDERCLGHETPRIPYWESARRNGNPKASSRARPSALVRAVVTMVMSIPRTVSILS